MNHPALVGIQSVVEHLLHERMRELPGAGVARVDPRGAERMDERMGLGDETEDFLAGRFLDRGDHVEDTRTGLLWQKDGTASGLRISQTAARACVSVSLSRRM